MAQRRKVGRNDRCPCGSGKKYKLCCEAKQKGDRRSNVWLMVLAGILIAGLVYAAATFEMGEAPRRVWSEEHQHYHTE